MRRCRHIHMSICKYAPTDICGKSFLSRIQCSMKTLSVTLIVKNEERVLKRLMDCLSFADEIVVVDTGSSDGTMEIARDYTDKVYRVEWQDDFSSARNFALSKATMQYVMWLDADDIVTPANVKKIVKWKKSDDRPDTVMAKYCTAFKGDVATIYFYRERIFVNDGRAVWVNKVHEVVVPFGKIVYSDIEVWHKPVGSHGSRNLQIYRNMLKRGEALDTRNSYYYARELFYNGYYSQSAENLRNFIARRDAWEVDRVHAMLMLADCYSTMQMPDKSLTTLVALLSFGYPSAECCYKIGKIFLDRNQYETAAFWFESATRLKPPDKGFVNLDYHTFFPWMQLCVCYYYLNDQKKAYKYFLKAEKMYPDNASVRYNRSFFDSLANDGKLKE